MLIAVIGGRGWIGSKMVKLLERDDIPYYHILERMENLTELKEGTTHVLCVAGRTHGIGCNNIDYLQDKPEENLRDNLYGVLNVAKLCKDIHMTYIGTGCIYTSHENRVFNEEDKPNFFGSQYSLVKGITDQLLKDMPHVLNLRIRMPITDDLSDTRNMLTKLLNYAKIHSTVNSVSVLQDVLPIAIDMMIQDKTGVYNLVNPDPITHIEILDLLGRTDYELVDEDELNLKAYRSHCILDTHKISELYVIPNARDFIKKLRK